MTNFLEQAEKVWADIEDMRLQVELEKEEALRKERRQNVDSFLLMLRDHKLEIPNDGIDADGAILTSDSTTFPFDISVLEFSRTGSGIYYRLQFRHQFPDGTYAYRSTSRLLFKDDLQNIGEELTWARQWVALRDEEWVEAASLDVKDYVPESAEERLGNAIREFIVEVVQYVD